MSYDNSTRDMEVTLRQMMATALQRRCGNHIEARQDVERWVKQDRRYDGFSAAVLAERADQFSNGAKLNWDDPRLRGEPAPPLAKDLYW